MRIVVLCGPPCAGKTTLAYHLAQHGDVVLDFDHIAQELGSPVRWLHPEPYRSMAEQEMQHRIELAYLMPGDGTAWVIQAKVLKTGPELGSNGPSASACGATGRAKGPENWTRTRVLRP